jgi:hypothetical protein
VITPGTSPSIPSFINSIINIPSATAPTSQGPTQTPIAYMCPANDGRVVMENGLSYVLNCNSTTSGIAYSSKQVANSFNDCFKECDQSSVSGGANYCSAFTYEGADNGVGSGTCYLYNGVSQGFVPATGKKAISAIRAVNYIPDAVVSGVTYSFSALPTLSLDSGLPTGTNLLSTLTPLSLSVPLPDVSVSATVAASVTVGAGVGVGLPSASISLSTPLLAFSLSSLVTIPTSFSNLITTGTCNNGGNILNGCVAATATLNPGVGVSGGVAIGPSSSPILAVSLSASVGVSVSAGVDLGLGVSAGSSGLSLGLSPSVGLGMSGGLGLGGGLGGGSGAAPTTISTSARVSATPGSGSPSSPSSTGVPTTSYYITPMSPVVTTTPSLSTTWVYTTSTVTSCLTAGGVLTCPLGGMFTTLPSTSGAVTSISTSTSIRTSISVSVSVSISYITVTAPSAPTSTSLSLSLSTSLPLSTPLPLSLSLPTSITSFSTRASTSSRATSTSTACAGVVNAVGLCVL